MSIKSDVLIAQTASRVTELEAAVRELKARLDELGKKPSQLTLPKKKSWAQPTTS